MKKRLCVFLILLVLVFSCAFDAIYNPEEQPTSGEKYSEVSQEQAPDQQTLPENQNGISTDGQIQEQQGIDSEQEQWLPSEPPEGPEQSSVQAQPGSESEGMPAPVFQGINDDQLYALRQLFDEMTAIGQGRSGWFAEGNYTPCDTWYGITCTDGLVTGLKFENAWYFSTFPEALLTFSDLKSLVFRDTLMRGPLPESLFTDLDKLEVLEMSGNYLTGEIPDLSDAFTPLREITISDNLDDDRKSQLGWTPDYAGAVDFYLNADDFDPAIDLEPGLDGELPENWSALYSLTKIDFSGNRLSGQVPDSFTQLPYLVELDLRDNLDSFEISDDAYAELLAASENNPSIILDGIRVPVPEEVPAPDAEPLVELPPVEEPDGDGNSGEPEQSNRGLLTVQDQNSETGDADAQDGSEQGTLQSASAETGYIDTSPTQIPPTDIPYVEPTQAPPTAVPYLEPTQVPPTEVPYVAPTQVPPTAQTIFIVVTATPVPQWYTATPQSYYPTQQPYYYPTATPYYPQYYSYPTATPYTYYNPNWIYPTATSSYSYQYNPQVLISTQVPTIQPTQDQAALLGFTYKLEAMTENNIPMTWRYTGMQEYSIVYLDASGNLYPAFAMEWKGASEICNSSVCNASVSVPDELLQQGRFSLQLRVRDASGKIYNSDPVEMEVSQPPQPTPTPVPEQPKSLLGGFFEWLFGPIIRLFGGGK